MKRLMKTWRRNGRTSRMLVLKVDRPRRIDRFIDYFGGLVETQTPCMFRVPVTARRSSSVWAPS
jgi:hypothetical protein